MFRVSRFTCHEKASSMKQVCLLPGLSPENHVSFYFRRQTLHSVRDHRDFYTVHSYLVRAIYLSDYLINFACLLLTKNEYEVTRATYLRTRVFISEVQKINDITVEHSNLYNPHIGLMIKILMVFLARRLTSQLM